MNYLIAFLPIENQAEFADDTTRQNLDKMHWLQAKMMEFNPDEYNGFAKLTETGIGNLALIATKGVSQVAAHRAAQGLNNYAKWMMATQATGFSHFADPNDATGKLERGFLYIFPGDLRVKFFHDRMTDKFAVIDKRSAHTKNGEAS